MDKRESVRFAVGYEKNDSVEFEICDRTLIIHMKEDLDHHNAIFIREHADKKLVTKNIQNVIFDFSHVSFMDSSGIGVILGRYKKLRLLGNGKLIVTGVSDCVNRILTISGLYSIIEKYKDITEAFSQIK
jgi:stage II sporulation protein AA (anti-sigma F factor antagonist)